MSNAPVDSVPSTSQQSAASELISMERESASTGAAVSSPSSAPAAGAEAAVEMALVTAPPGVAGKSQAGPSVAAATGSSQERLQRSGGESASGPGSTGHEGYGTFDAEPTQAETSVDMASTANEEAPIVPETGPRSDEEKLSSFMVFMNLMKASLGTGILAMPMAMRNAGYIVGSFGFGAIALVCLYCIHLLVKSSRILRTRKGVPTLEYEDTAAAAFETSGSQCMKRWAWLPRVFTELFLAAYMIGACSVYVLFVKENLKQLFDVSCQENDWSSIDYLVHLALALMILVVLPDFKTLTPVSFIANLAMVLGVGMCVGLSLYLRFGHVKAPQLEYNRTLDTWANVAVENVTVEPWVEWHRLPLFFGTAVFALEGIGMVLTLENKMEDPTRFLDKYGVLNISMGILASLYLLMGVVGYVAFGEKTKGSITLNLPDSTFAFWVRKLVTMGVFLTYPVQFYIPERIIWKWLGVLADASLCAGSWRCIRVCVERSRSHPVGRFIFKQLLMGITVALPLAVPRLGPLIALVGAVCLSMLGLTLPTVIHAFTNWQEIRQNWRQLKMIGTLAFHVFILCLGVGGLVAGTISSVKEMRELHAATE